MVKIISLVNHKGGVGKTTSALNLGKALTLLGKKVLLIDIDPQANLTLCCGIEQPATSIYEVLMEDAEIPICELTDKLHLLPSDLVLASAINKLHTQIGGYFKLKKSIKTISKKYDFVLIDCPPSLDILTMNAFIASQNLLIVVQSHYLSTVGLQTILDTITEIKENLDIEINISGILLTQTAHTNISKAVIDTVKNIYQNKVFATHIRQSVKLVEASAEHKTIFEYDEKSSGAVDYMALAKELV